MEEQCLITLIPRFLKHFRKQPLNLKKLARYKEKYSLDLKLLSSKSETLEGTPA
jgi:hypothetical protein